MVAGQTYRKNNQGVSFNNLEKAGYSCTFLQTFLLVFECLNVFVNYSTAVILMRIF